MRKEEKEKERKRGRLEACSLGKSKHSFLTGQGCDSQHPPLAAPNRNCCSRGSDTPLA